MTLPDETRARAALRERYGDLVRIIAHRTNEVFGLGRDVVVDRMAAEIEAKKG